MKTNNIYDIISREIESVYPKYISSAYYYQRFPLTSSILLDDEEVEIYGYLQREGNNLEITIETIGFDRLPEPMRFGFPVYDDDEDEEFED